jgi:hypothetical protein
MSSESEGYLAYMLRLWQASDQDGSVWRASLESPHTGERHGFSNLELLFAFLEEKTAGQLRRAEGPDAAHARQAGLDRGTDQGRSIIV